MESLADGITNLISFQLVLGSMFGIYLAPLIIAVVRDHHRLPWICFLNFATGWTVAGWIAALVWSVTRIRQPAAIMRIGSAQLGALSPQRRESPYALPDRPPPALSKRRSPHHGGARAGY